MILLGLVSPKSVTTIGNKHLTLTGYISCNQPVIILPIRGAGGVGKANFRAVKKVLISKIKANDR